LEEPNKKTYALLIIVAVIVASTLIYYNFFRAPLSPYASLPELTNLKISLTHASYINQTLSLTWNMDHLDKNDTYSVDTCVIVIGGNDYVLNFTPVRQLGIGDQINIKVGVTGLPSDAEFDTLLIIKDSDGTILGKVTNHVLLS